MLGTKWPSITSRWIQSAPAASTARTSSPSLEKSEARIDGAMTRGRDANWADMCAFRKPRSMRWIGFRVTRARSGGNAGGQGRGEGGNFCRHGINCRGRGASPRYRKPLFYWVFGAGTALADPFAVNVKR